MILIVLACALAGVMLGCVAWELYVSRRFHGVAMAQWRRSSAYSALTTAYLTRADPTRAKAGVVAADEAVHAAEAKLPRRSRATRKYYASKQAS